MRSLLLRVNILMISVGLLMGWAAPVLAKDYIYAPCVNNLNIIDCELDAVVKTIPYNDYIVNAAYSPDGKKYYLNAFHSIYAIDTTTDKLVDTFKFSTELSKVTIIGFQVSHDGSKLYLSCAITKKKQNIPKLNVLDPQLIVFDIKKKKMIRNFTIPRGAMGVVTLRNDANNIILVGLDIHKLNLKTGKLTKMMGILNPEEGQEVKNSLVIWQNGGPGDHGIFVNPYYTATGLGYFIFDRNTGKIDTLVGKDVWFEYSTIVSPDKKYLYAAMDELIKIDFATGETIKAIPLPRGTSYALSLTADGRKIYVGPAGNDMQVYDTKNFALLGTIELTGDGVIAHRFTK